MLRTDLTIIQANDV